MRRAARRITAVIAAVALLFLASAAGWTAPITRPLVRAVLTAAAPLYAAGETARALVGDKDGQGDSELERLKVETASLRTLASENDALKQALGYRARTTEKTVLANVVAADFDDAGRVLLIDRGTEDGIAPGQAVILGDGVLLGKTLDVRSQTASVIIVTDSRSATAVSLQGKTDTLGVLEGSRGLSASINLIPAGAAVAPGDTVVTSGLEAGVRRGYPVGVIESVSASSQDAFQSATIAPFAVSRRPLYVLVVVSTLN
ncbi:rod shape-determining protein MreC [Candidatus Uhrbacteria bacterium]|nr:rod shape-determining protein MreC [Candidatus Uhrbacteria bacterium]